MLAGSSCADLMGNEKYEMKQFTTLFCHDKYAQLVAKFFHEYELDSFAWQRAQNQNKARVEEESRDMDSALPPKEQAERVMMKADLLCGYLER